MAETGRETQVRVLEDALQKLRGVRQARVDVTPAGIKSVRLLVVPERNSEIVLEDAQAAIAATLGEPIEPARIQILRTGEIESGRDRRKLSSVLTERSGDRFTARVTLELGGDVLVGESDAPIGPRFEYSSMARATLQGVGALIDFPLELQGVFILNQGEERFAVVLVTRGYDMLVGSALVRTDEYDAIARATLDAVNRFVARAMEMPGQGIPG